MIIIVPLNGDPVEQFENYNELFECIIEGENLKLIANDSDSENTDWSFTVYQPKRVAALYTNSKDSCATIMEAYEEKLPLIEICTGDYQKPLCIVLTPNIDMDYLKRKWCVDWCTFHDLVVREV